MTCGPIIMMLFMQLQMENMTACFAMTPAWRCLSSYCRMRFPHPGLIGNTRVHLPPTHPEDGETKVLRAPMAGAVATAGQAGCWTQTWPSSARTLLRSEEIAGIFTLKSSLKCGK